MKYSIRLDIEYTVLNSITRKKIFSVLIVEQLDHKIVCIVYIFTTIGLEKKTLGKKYTEVIVILLQIFFSSFKRGKNIFIIKKTTTTLNS